MRHLMRRTIQGDWLGRGQSPFRLQTVPFLLSFLLPLFFTGDVGAQFNGALRGEYNVTILRACKGIATLSTIAVKGTTSYDGSGAGTFIGQSLYVDPATENQADQTCTVAYTVNSDGTFTQQMSCNLTFVGGVNAGSTATLTGIDIQGRLSLDGITLLISDTVPNQETLTFTTIVGPPPGSPQLRTCNSSGTATSRR